MALGVRGGSGEEVCWMRQHRCHLGNFKAKGSGLYRLTVRHGVSYGTLLTGFRTEQVALCIWQRTLLSPGRRNTAGEVNGRL